MPRSRAAPLRCVVYVSTAMTPLPDDELEFLLTDGRAYNREHAVSGVLLYHDGTFMQCFEGRPRAVQRVFDRIRASRRHHSIVVLMDEPAAERRFSDWTIGLTHPSSSELLRLQTARWSARVAATDVNAAEGGIGLLVNFWADAKRFYRVWP